MLVDDEDSIRKVVEQIIKKDGYNFCYADNGEEVLEMFRQEKPHLIVLDVMLPGIDGFELCRRIRQESSVPIIMLSAKGDIVDKSVGFNMGADDYIPKPFSPIELSLRIKALIRRTETQDKVKKFPEIIKIRELEINCLRHEVKVRGEKIELTPKEFELLSFLANNPGQVFTRQQLFNTLWGEDCFQDTGTITVFIRKIREKIELNSAKPEYILTVWGVGYKFCNE
ncbi:MAG TPA: response regulator transcription factor [Peptococcaceae bacterium]|nr:response regulator transcription factor [Peptococcaceae bacterium]